MTEIDAHLAASLSRHFRLIRQLGQGGMGAGLSRAEWHSGQAERRSALYALFPWRRKGF